MEIKDIYEDMLEHIVEKMAESEPDSADYIECKRIFHLIVLNIIFGKYFAFKKKDENNALLITDKGGEYLVELTFLEENLSPEELNEIFTRKNEKQEEVKECTDIIPDKADIPEINEDTGKVAVAEEKEVKSFLSYEELLQQAEKEKEKELYAANTDKIENFDSSNNDQTEKTSNNKKENQDDILDSISEPKEIITSVHEINIETKGNNITSEQKNENEPKMTNNSKITELESEKEVSATATVLLPDTEPEKKENKNEQKEQKMKKQDKTYVHYIVPSVKNNETDTKPDKKSDTSQKNNEPTVQAVEVKTSEIQNNFIPEIGENKKLINTFFYDRYDIKCRDSEFTLCIYPLKRQAVAMIGTMMFVTLYDGKEYFRGYISENEHKTSITFNYNDLTINITGKWRNGKFITTVMNRTDTEHTEYNKKEIRPEKETENTHLIMDIDGQLVHVFPAMFENHSRHGLCGCCIYNETANELFSPTGQFVVGYSKKNTEMLECFIHGKNEEAVLNVEKK